VLAHELLAKGERFQRECMAGSVNRSDGRQDDEGKRPMLEPEPA
jgi:hypothetical protein